MSLKKRAGKVFLALITGMLFAGSFIAGKYTTADLGPITTSLLRYIAALLFLGSLVCLGRRSALKIHRSDLFLFMLLGLFGIVGYHYFFFSALRYTEVANTAIINATSPVVTGLLAAVFIRERLSLTNHTGVVIASCSIIFLLMKGSVVNIIHLRINYGDGLMLLAVLSWAIYALLIKKCSETYSSLCLTFYATLFGVLFLFVLAPFENALSQLKGISTRSIWAVMYMGAAASGLGYLLYNMSVSKIGPTRTSSLVYSSVPVFTACLALLFFGEQITWIMILSILGILLGLNLMMKERSRYAHKTSRL